LRLSPRDEPRATAGWLLLLRLDPGYMVTLIRQRGALAYAL
jgi:hypothetical protein